MFEIDEFSAFANTLNAVINQNAISMEVVEKYIRMRDKLLHGSGVSFLSKRVTLNETGKSVHYLELGKGKPLIMIHGGGSNSNEWINVLKPLSDHFHLHVVDRPGCGLSDEADYRGVDLRKSAISFIGSFMDAVGLEKALLMGQSMGGYFSICFALADPERVEKLLLIGAPAGLNLWIPYMLRALATKGINKILVNTMAKPGFKNSKFIHKNLLVAQIDKLPDDYLMLNYYGQLLPGGITGFMSLLENVLTLKGWRKDLYIGDQLSKLKMPVRFIWGDKDAFEKPGSGKQKALAISNMKFEIVENAGHCPWLDEPEKCVDLIVSMLQE